MKKIESALPNKTAPPPNQIRQQYAKTYLFGRMSFDITTLSNTYKIYGVPCSKYIPSALSLPFGADAWHPWNPFDESMCAISICGCCNANAALDVANLKWCCQTPVSRCNGAAPTSCCSLWNVDGCFTFDKLSEKVSPSLPRCRKCAVREPRTWLLHPSYDFFLQTCQSPEEAMDMMRSVSHPANMCPGNCKQHPLLQSVFTMSLTDVSEAGDQEVALARIHESPSTRAAREQAEAAKLQQLVLEGEVLAREVYAREQHEQARLGRRRVDASKLIPHPCKWMYKEVVDPRTGKATPTTFDPKSECWAWRYTDPRTKKRVEPCTCMRLHPGQPQWCTEWQTMTWSEAVNHAKNRQRRAEVPTAPVAPARFAALSPSGGSRPAPPARAAPAAPASRGGRWASLELSDSDDNTGW